MIEHLIEICREIKDCGGNLHIQMHNYPDVDAIASAWGLQSILSHYDICADIVYVGDINRVSSEHLVSLYKIDLKKHDGNFTDNDYVICIDCQKKEMNVTQNGGHIFACVDHHPSYGNQDYKFKLVNITGSCSSIIANEFSELDICISSEIATALLYGIKMDTLQFTRGVHEYDIIAYQILFKYSNAENLSFLETSSLKLTDLVAYGDAIKNIVVVSDVASSYVPFDCPDGLIASLSDFMLSIDEISISIVFSKREHGIKLSVRSILPYVDAGILTKTALDGIGNGGGHAMFAGGFIPRDNLVISDDKIQQYLTGKFFHAYGQLMLEHI